MRVPRRDWPAVVKKLVDAILGAARGLDVHGRVKVEQTRDGFVVSVTIPVIETIAKGSFRRTYDR